MEELIAKLHPLERKIVPYLKDGMTLKDIESKTGLSDIEVARAVQWLENKGALKSETTSIDVISLGENGKAYLEKGLPEKKFLEMLKAGPISISDMQKKGELSPQEIGSSAGILKSNGAIDMKDGKVFLTESGKSLIGKEPLEMQLISKIARHADGRLGLLELDSKEKRSYENLIKRKDILNKTVLKITKVKLTDVGKDLAKKDMSGVFADRLTSEMLKDGTWKDVTFRSFDLNTRVPSIYGGRRHFVNHAVDHIKSIWLELGFKEMEGDMIQTSFWDLDVLFVPQDHPARQMQDTFYIKNPGKGKLPSLWKKVKEVHENGSDTGSKGWGGTWSEDKAKENMLRTHTTTLSAHTLSRLKKEDLPAKFFAVGKVFRNEALDWKHLFEFYQVEGIVVDPDANMKHLKGYLRDFYRKMGYNKIRMRPAHFPYTEPSVEIEVFHPVRKQWVELGGAGIFRPEVTKTLLGFECPVLAWGQGMARIISEYWKITDIRELYKNDLKQMREMKFWME